MLCWHLLNGINRAPLEITFVKDGSCQLPSPTTLNTGRLHLSSGSGPSKKTHVPVSPLFPLSSSPYFFLTESHFRGKGVGRREGRSVIKQGGLTGIPIPFNGVFD